MTLGSLYQEVHLTQVIEVVLQSPLLASITFSRVEVKSVVQCSSGSFVGHVNMILVENCL